MGAQVAVTTTSWRMRANVGDAEGFASASVVPKVRLRRA